MEIDDIPLDLTAVLGSAELSKGGLGSLKAGDILVLDRQVSDPLPLYANEEKRYLGYVCRVQEKKAIKVVARDE